MPRIDWVDFVDFFDEMEEKQSFSIERLKEYYDTDDIYNRIPPTKHHLRDKFVHPGGMTAIITDINESGRYSLNFIETPTERIIGVPIKNAWYDDGELDNFVKYVDKN